MSFKPDLGPGCRSLDFHIGHILGHLLRYILGACSGGEGNHTVDNGGAGGLAAHHDQGQLGQIACFCHQTHIAHITHILHWAMGIDDLLGLLLILPALLNGGNMTLNIQVKRCGY